MTFKHTPVLLDEIASYLTVEMRTIIDFTLGGANHAYSLLNQNRNAFLYGVDRDEEAVAASRKKLDRFEGRFTLLHNSFSQAIKILNDRRVKADFILADLGVSSHQLSTKERGFSLRQNGPLDMRMDVTDTETAADVLNTLEESALAEIISTYGEERFAKRIAKAIVGAREVKPFATTGDLTECVIRSIPMKFQFGNIHAATKTFQAIRIYLNKELEELAHLLNHALDLLNPNGRLAIISFHSLEDRPVKQMFKKWEEPCTCPKQYPLCICGLKPQVKRLSRKAIKASAGEIEQNIRSRSAKLRVVEKL